MREKMKKMLFLMLFLIILGAAKVNSQVRIGGNGQPNPAAVLDLNADNNATGTKGLALPRVSLTDINTALTGSPTVNGMMIYNTNASVGAGVYYWDTNKWIKVSDGTFTEVDGVIGNEIVDATANGGLERAGSGTAAAPYTLGIASEGITTAMLGDGTVTAVKLAVPSRPGTVYVSDGTSWKLSTLSSTAETHVVRCEACAGAPVGTNIEIGVADSTWFPGTLYRCNIIFDGVVDQRGYVARPYWNGVGFYKIYGTTEPTKVALVCGGIVN
ncbi:hypothetical protein FACS189451_04630 [Bacteroidia bacterium]|nr:hypothetical protein FACS189451_04630 [Bacteroidia bacterium]